MKLTTIFALAVLVACMPLAAFADSAVFTNQDGQFTQNMTDLTLTGSSLLGVTGLGAFDCPNPQLCSGTVGLTTGSGNVMSGTVGTSAVFTPLGAAAPPPGSTFGSITITGNPAGPGGAFLFTGMFSKATWSDLSGVQTGPWTFTGIIMNGTLTEGGVIVEQNIEGATIQLTKIGSFGGTNGHHTWEDGSGSTTIPSPVPEQSTLTLLGTGLIGIGVLARRRWSRQSDGVL